MKYVLKNKLIYLNNRCLFTKARAMALPHSKLTSIFSVVVYPYCFDNL